MRFIIPTITLFQQRTPGRLMGRVVSGAVLVVFGGICAAAGVIGLLLPSMRSAR